MLHKRSPANDPRPPRENALVVPVDASSLEECPFRDDLSLVYLGEIVNMPEHGIFAGTKTGRVYSGYHIGGFRELGDDEV